MIKPKLMGLNGRFCCSASWLLYTRKQAEIAVHSGLKRLNIAETPVKDLRPLLALPALESVTLCRTMEGAAEALEGRQFALVYE